MSQPSCTCAGVICDLDHVVEKMQTAEMPWVDIVLKTRIQRT